MSDPIPVQSQAMVDLIDALNDKQRTAFESLRGGSSFAVAAERAGVGRVTVYRWVKSDAHFRAAYNAWRQELAESAQSRLLKLADKAVDCVEHAIDNNDYATAVTVLSKLGIMRKTRRASIEPEIVQMQVELAQQREKYRAAVGMMRLLLEKAGLPPEQQMEFIRQRGVDPSTLAGYEGIPNLQDEDGEEFDPEDAADEDPADEPHEGLDQQDAPREPPAEQTLHMPAPQESQGADLVSQAG